MLPESNSSNNGNRSWIRKQCPKGHISLSLLSNVRAGRQCNHPTCWMTKVLKKSFQIKNYYRSDGTLIRYMGYEDGCIRLLKDTFPENCISTTTQIMWEGGLVNEYEYRFQMGRHLYITDIVIKMGNMTIEIEVKSGYTMDDYNKNKLLRRKNLLKWQAVSRKYGKFDAYIFHKEKSNLNRTFILRTFQDTTVTIYNTVKEAAEDNSTSGTLTFERALSIDFPYRIGSRGSIDPQSMSDISTVEQEEQQRMQELDSLWVNVD